MRDKFTLFLRALLLTAFLISGSAFAQQTPSADKPLAGKRGFSLDQFRSSLFDGKAKQIQARMSAIRLKKRGKLETLVNRHARNANRADHLFRLAETWREEAKYQYLLSREKYDQAYECYDEKRCTQEPPEPEEDLSIALKYYRQIMREHPDYRRMNEVIYHLGRAALDTGKARKDIQLQKEGVRHLDQLVQKYPKSRYVPQAHLALAEYFFETDSLFYAKTNYEKIITNFKRHSMYNYALYKLGWVYFNLTEFEKTITTFKKVIASISGKGNRARVEFRSQALNDLIVAWAEIDDGWREARRYFLKEVGEPDTYVKLEKMADLLVSKDKDGEAIDLYKHLIDHDKMSEKVPAFYDAVLEVNRKIGDESEIEGTINEFATYFDKKSTWWAANKGDDEISTRARKMVDNGVYYLANRYHTNAQKADDKRKPSKADYTQAAHYYKKHLEEFPDHKSSYVFNFYYAEILYHQIKNNELAAEQYEAVLEKDKKGKYVEDAALGVIYAIESMLVDAGLKEAGKAEVQYVSKEKKTDLKADVLKPIPRTDLHPLETRYISAADTYVEVLKAALSDTAFRKKYPKRGSMIPNIMFIAAQTYYRHGQFAPAVKRLMVIFDLYPNHKMANVAVNTIIDAYARLKHWEKIETWARKLIESKNFKVKKKAELQDMIAIALTENARDLTKQRRFDEAIEVQQKLVDEFGRQRKDMASKALFNIGVIHESARRFPQAVAAYEQVIKKYPKEDVAVQAQFDIGSLYESQTEFVKAAQAFIQMERFKTHAKASDAIRNAGLIYEAMEEYRKAHETFERYLKTFKDKDDVKQVAFHSAEVLKRSGETKDLLASAKSFEKIAKSHGKKDKQYRLRAIVSAALSYKKADKVKNRKKVQKLLAEALKIWAKLDPSAPPVPGSKMALRQENRMKAAARAIAAGKKPKPFKKPKKAKKPTGPPEEIKASTKAYAANGALELAEYAYDDYSKLTIEAIRKKGPRKGTFDPSMLKKTLIAKAEALTAAEKFFGFVLAFKDPGMNAAGAFRGGLIMYEFAESLFEAPVPPELTDEDEIDEYRFQLEEFAAPIQEKSLKRFTQALKQALDKNVYNKWSRLSATYAAKVNPDEFPISDFAGRANKTKDTLSSTSFIKMVRRGAEVVDFAQSREEAKEEAAKKASEAEKKAKADKKEGK